MRHKVNMEKKPVSNPQNRKILLNTLPFSCMMRARMMLKLADGKMVKDAAAELGEMPDTVILWRDEASREWD